MDEEQQQKDELKKRLLGITTEVGAGIGTDAATTGLLAGGPWGWLAYAGINFGQGAYTNYLVQKHLYGNDEINWGEVLSSGAVGAIPFMNIGVSKGTAKFVGQANTVKRGLVGGIGIGVGGEQLRVGIDEGRPLTLPELFTSGAVGGLAGAGFTQLNKSISNRAFRRRYKKDFLGEDNKFDLAKVQARQQKVFEETPGVALLKGKMINNVDPNHGLPTHTPTGEEIIWKNFIPKSTLKRQAEIKGYMRDMGLVDEVFDWKKFDKWSKKKIQHTTKKGKKKVIYQNQKAARDFIGWFTADPKKVTDFYKINATNSVERQEIIKFYGAMMRALGLQSKHFQLHHLVPLKASIPLYHGLKYDSEEWWKLTAYLLKNEIQAGDSLANLRFLLGERGATKIKRTQGGEYQLKTPHSVSHSFSENKLGKDGRKLFTDKVLKNIEENPDSRWGYAEKFVHITRDTFDITNLAEEMLNTKWKNLDLDVEDVTNTLNKLDENGYISSIPKEYQVDEINKMIAEIASTGKDGEFYIRSIAAFEEQEILRNIAKTKIFKDQVSDLADNNAYFAEIVKNSDEYLEDVIRTSKQFARYSSYKDPQLYLDVIEYLQEVRAKTAIATQETLGGVEFGNEILIIKLMEIFWQKYGAK